MDESHNVRAEDITILLVEDEKFTIDVYQKLVSRYVSHVHTAANGEEGLEVYKRTRPDIVIADIVMPLMDGLEMSGMIKAIDPEVQIIVSTAYMDTKMMGRAIEAGVDHYITKPLKRKLFLSVLEKSIDAVLQHREAQNEIKRLTELLTAIKQINEMIVKTESRETLVKEVCHILVNRKLYSGVWIALVDQNGVPYWGFSDGFRPEEFEKMLEKTRKGEKFNCFQLSEEEQTREVVICDKDKNCVTCPLNVCTTDNFSFMLKLEYHGKLYGYFNISINEEILKNQDEHDLLTDVATDLAYALYRFELEEIGKQNEELLLHQSRLAAMGEMISMIAHQWRQPIATIAMSVNNVLIDMELNGKEDDHLKSHMSAVLDQVMYLSKTIDDFKDFFNPKRQKRESTLGQLIEELIKMMQKSLASSDIRLEVEGGQDREVCTYDNELIHVLINIVKNAKDQLIEKKVSDGWIKIYYTVDESSVLITIDDNAGGIPEANLLKIFEPYYSTKGENGTGLGLYMSDTIITKHFNGSITAMNTDQGARFKIEFPVHIKTKEHPC